MDHLEEHVRACTDMMTAGHEMPGMADSMGMMGAMGGMGGMGGGVMALISLLIPLLIVGLLAAIAILLARSNRPGREPPLEGRTIADARYARGELTRDEYLTLRRDLEGTDGR